MNSQENPLIFNQNQKNRLFKYLIAILFGPILICIRLPLFLISVIIFICYHKFFVHFIFLSGLKRVITLFFNYIICRMILYSLGFHNIEQNFQLCTKRNNNIPTMKSGSIILSNHSSPVDILYLTQIVSPIFCKFFIKQSNEQIKEILFTPLGLTEIMNIMLNKKFLLPSELNSIELSKIKLKKISLENIIRQSFDYKQGPLVIFYEGCATNGECLLKIDEILLLECEKIQERWRRQMTFFKLKYDENHYLFSQSTQNSGFLYFIKLMANPFNYLQVEAKNTQNNFKQLDVEIESFFTQQNQIKQTTYTWREYDQLSLINKNK